ncbi:hypothetical protein GCM10027059_42250 [Myceligenerans halotolerans]
MNLVEARNLARDLMDQHGLADWRFEYDDAKRRAGMCHFARRRISLSAPLTTVYDEGEVRDTVLHEIAHALAGREAGHGAQWRAKAQEIGCSGLRYVDPSAPTLDGPWIGVCPRGHRMTRFRRPGAPMSCRTCGGGAKNFEPLHLIAWTYRGHDAAMGERYERELRELCVQVGVRVSVEPGTEERIARAASGRWPLLVEPLDLSALDLDEPMSDVPAGAPWRSPVARR